MKKMMLIAVTAVLALGGATLAGEGYSMKCGAEPARDSKTGQPVKPCGYETEVSFGGGMLMQQVTGYCVACGKFVYLHWAREGLPPGLADQVKPTPPPKPLGQVWDSATGRKLTVYACPQCKGPVAEIKSVNDLKHCPACGRPGFGIDKDKPMMAID